MGIYTKYTTHLRHSSSRFWIDQYNKLQYNVNKDIIYGEPIQMTTSLTAGKTTVANYDVHLLWS